MVDPRFARPVFERLRRMCLALPDATEAVAWGHPVFKTGTRTFAALEIVKGRPSIALNATREDASRLAKKKDFIATPYGRGVYVSRWLDSTVNWTEMKRLIARSHEHAVSARPSR